MTRPFAIASSPSLDAQDEIRRIALKHLKKAGAIGTLPTPIEQLAVCANIDVDSNLDSARESFLAKLSKPFYDNWTWLRQKLRGIADLRERVIYVPDTPSSPRVRFTEGHELGHELIPWHNLDPGYLDDDASLSPEAKEEFDLEANFFSAEIIFQGTSFRKLSREYRAEFNSIFALARLHDASRHATMRRFVEESDEAVVAVPFWPSNYHCDDSGFPVLNRGRATCSPSFTEKYLDFDIPLDIRTGHPWVAARDADGVFDGNLNLPASGSKVRFEWQAWWNKYCLLVLLRRKPLLRLLRR